MKSQRDTYCVDVKGGDVSKIERIANAIDSGEVHNVEPSGYGSLEVLEAARGVY